MSTHFNIFWRPDMDVDHDVEKEGYFANVHMLVGYNLMTITAYQDMAKVFRKTFPQAQDSDLICGQVRHSTWCENFSLLSWNVRIPKGEYPGWLQSTLNKETGRGGPSYYF